MHNQDLADVEERLDNKIAELEAKAEWLSSQLVSIEARITVATELKLAQLESRASNRMAVMIVQSEEMKNEVNKT